MTDTNSNTTEDIDHHCYILNEPSEGGDLFSIIIHTPARLEDPNERLRDITSSYPLIPPADDDTSGEAQE